MQEGSSLDSGSPSQRRPRDRRQQIADNAAELFAARGFHDVKIDEIAEATGITARAVYRHYSNKQDLLSHVVNADQQRLIDALKALRNGNSGDRDEDVRSMVEASLTSRRLSLMWQREARHLDGDDYARVRENTRWIANEVARKFLEPKGLDPMRTEIRSWLVVSLLTSPGHYELSIPRPLVLEYISSAVRNVIDGPARESTTPAPIGGSETGRMLSSRREQLLRSAAKAFRRRGFAGVAIDDMAAEAGVVGPAIYRYFDSKADLLASIITRFSEWNALENTRALGKGNGPGETLELLVSGYIRIALEATDALACVVTETLYLPQGDAERLSRMRAEALSEWVACFGALWPELTEGVAQLLAGASRTIVDDLVRIPHLRYDLLITELHDGVMATLRSRVADGSMQRSVLASTAIPR